MRYFLVVLAMLALGQAHAANIAARGFINAGTFLAVDGETSPYLAFNPTETFNQKNNIYRLKGNDVLTLTVINNDDANHVFFIPTISSMTDTIAPGDSITYVVNGSENLVLPYYGGLDYPTNRALGLGGIISFSAKKTFCWNLKEYDLGVMADLEAGNVVDWTTYEPDYFTINDVFGDSIEADTLGAVRGNVSDTIHIAIVNNGSSHHSIHFHGYHLTVLDCSFDNALIGRSKDTVPVKKGEYFLLELVPDKPGSYPVHDHNLVAVTAGNVYGNGMFTTLVIQ